ncbi:MAG: hypothetical protein AAGA58_03515 [Verrucomicrobiota bacterium]
MNEEEPVDGFGAVEAQRRKFEVEGKAPERDVQGPIAQLLYKRVVIFHRISESENLSKLIVTYLVAGLALTTFFGACLGMFAGGMQILASAVKLPLLLYGTGAVCLPALFTFNVLLGSRLSFGQTLAVLATATFLLAAVLASLAPIVFFFVISTTSKGFVILLCVACLTVAGVFGIMHLWKAMGYLTVRAGQAYDSKIIKTWTLIYAFVGTQLSWLLRPFVGDPGEFAFIRNVGGNFYTGLLKIVMELFTGGSGG